MHRDTIAPLLITIAILSVSMLALYGLMQIGDATLTEQTTAIYKGYMISGKYCYPIIEIDGKEYVSTHSQPVRDNSYIGNEVTIKHCENHIAIFEIIWDETELETETS